MKLFRRSTALFLTLLMILAALASCTNDPGKPVGEESDSGEVTVTDAHTPTTDKPDSPDTAESVPSETAPPATSAPETEPPTETEAPPEPQPDFVMDEGMNVKIVYPDEYSRLGSTNEYVKAINSFSVDAGKLTAAKISRGTDYSKNGVYDSDSVEILVGNTAYPETAKGLEKLTYGNSVVTIVGNKLIIGGYSVEALEAAFANALKAGWQASLNENHAESSETATKKTLDELNKNKKLSFYLGRIL